MQPSEPGLVVLSTDASHASQATDLARRLGLPLSGTPCERGLGLVVTPHGLRLRSLEPGGPGDVAPEFLGGVFGYRRRQGIGCHEPLARAAGIGRHGPCSVLDATPGLGRDSFVMASLGCPVLAVERHPVMAELLADALSRARREPALQATIERITLVVGEAAEQLRTDPAPDVVLLDPMFPGRRPGKALVRKEMRVIRRLVGDDLDAPELLARSRDVARRRVIVRRPAGAPALDPAHSADFSVASRRTRLDVYLAR